MAALTATAMDTKSAAAYLGLAPRTLHNWRNLRKGPRYHKHGSRVVYYQPELDDYKRATAK